MHRTASNETGLVSKIPTIFDKEYAVIAPGLEKHQCKVKHWYL